MDEIHYLFIGMRIGYGRHIADRFVQCNVVAFRRHGNLLSVNGDLIAVRVDVCPLSRYCLAIYFHPSPCNPLLGFAARGDSGGGEHSL